MDSSIQIEERASHWLAQRDSDAWGVSEEAAFRDWLSRSTLHVVAFVRLEAAWKQAKRLQALSAGVPPGSVPSPEEWQLRRFFESSADEDAPPAPVTPIQAEIPVKTAQVLSTRNTSLWALAASLLIVIAAGIVFYLWRLDTTYRTPVGGIALVPLSDGSKVTLNTDSKIHVAVTETERRVELEQGEAFFEVAKDPNRPFVVTAADKRIVAVGTQFSVRRDDDEVRVFVTEGQVRIEDETLPKEDKGEGDSTFSAGTVARVGVAGVLVQEKPVAEVEGYLSWRSGYLMFRNTPLADAIAEFNRYNARKIIIDDPSIAAMGVSGKFRATQFEAFVRLLEEGFPVRARADGERIVLTDRRKG